MDLTPQCDSAENSENKARIVYTSMNAPSNERVHLCIFGADYATKEPSVIIYVIEFMDMGQQNIKNKLMNMSY